MINTCKNMKVKGILRIAPILMTALFLSNATFVESYTFPTPGASVTSANTAPVYCTTANCTRATSTPPGTFYYDRRSVFMCSMMDPPSCVLSTLPIDPMAGKPVKTSYIFDIGNELNAKIFSCLHI